MKTLIHSKKEDGTEEPVDVGFEDLGTGFPIVLLHGYPFNRSMWSDQVNDFAQRYRLVIPDLRGLGETQVTPGVASMETMAADVAALMDHLKISSAVIGGLSMGGYVALAFYRLFSKRVRALVLADTRAQADTEEIKQNRAVQAEKALTEGMQGIAESMLPKLLAPETLTGRPEIVRRIREMIVQTKPEGAVAALKGMAQRKDQRPLLPNINVPTLILVGSEDPITPEQDSETMHNQINGSQLVIIDGAAHLSNIEQPREFNSALGGFLSSIAQSAADGVSTSTR